MFKKILMLFVLMFFITNAFAITDTNLIGYWNLNETSGTNLADSKGYDNNLTLNAGTVNQTGILGKAVSLTNSIPQHASGTISSSLTETTQCGWVYPTGGSELGLVYGIGDGDSSGNTLIKSDNAAGSGTKIGSFAPGVAYGPVSTVDFSESAWNFICFTKVGTTGKIYKNGSLIATTGNPVDAVGVTNYFFGGQGSTFGAMTASYDELSHWNQELTLTEIQTLYNGGTGVTYCPDVAGIEPTNRFDEVCEYAGIDANFDYSIKSTSAEIDFNDVSTTVVSTINDWNWIIDGVPTSTDQNFTLTGVIGSTDYNSCLIIKGYEDANVLNLKTDSKCQTVSSGRWYADWNISVWDESSLTVLDGISLNVSNSLGSLDFSFDQNTYLNYDNNLSSILDTTTRQTTLTFTLSGYGTRYYVFDANKFSEADLDLNFVLLPSSLGRNIEFQVYETDETTLYADTYIEMLLHDQDYNSAGRRKTDALGKVTFFINPNDANYTMRIYGTPQVDYNSMVLTVAKPNDETSGTAIDGNWDLEVSGLAWQTYEDLTGSQAIQIYANTFGTYGLTVGDDNSDYFDRKYYVNYLGGTTAATLQPYLVPVGQAVSTTLYTLSGYSQQPVGGIEIKIYKTISGVGRVLVEQVVTDAKGEALISLIANDEYEFEIYDTGVLLGSQAYSITSTSTTIYITVDDLGLTGAILAEGLVTVRFTPQRGRLIGNDTALTQKISVTDRNYGIVYTSAFIYVTNTDVNGTSGNDVNVWSGTITGLTNSLPLNNTNQTLDGNWFDTNGYLVVHIEVTTNRGIYYKSYKYKPLSGFDFYKAVGFDLRPAFGCPSTADPLIPCGGMLFIAIFVSIIITIGFAIETGFSGAEGMAGMFLVVMGVFTYFAWVPLGIMAIIGVSVIMLMLAIGGKNRI